MSHRVTIATIAAAAGVSKATVSRALHGDRGMDPTTRQRIRTLARELGYRRDEHQARSASARFQQHRDVEILHVHGDWQRDVFGIELERQVQEQGMCLRRLTCGQATDSREILERIIDDQASCLLIDGALLERFPALEQEPWKGRYVVLHASPIRPFRFASIKGNAFLSWLQCLENVRQRGYQRIGSVPMVHTPLHRDDHLRQAACAHFRDLHANDVPPYTGAMTQFDADDFFAWYQQYQPDVLVSLHAGPLRCLMQAGIELPFVACGWAGPLWGLDVSGIRSGHSAVCRAICALFERLLRLGASGPQDIPWQIQVPAEWHEGNTLPVVSG